MSKIVKKCAYLEVAEMQMRYIFEITPTKFTEKSTWLRLENSKNYWKVFNLLPGNTAKLALRFLLTLILDAGDYLLTKYSQILTKIRVVGMSSIGYEELNNAFRIVLSRLKVLISLILCQKINCMQLSTIS